MAKIIAPVVTIFNEEEKPDYAGNKKVIDFLIEGGLDGILVLGSAGEFPDLNEQERLDFFRFYAEYVNGRVELLAGTGCIRYADTLALSNAVYELGYTPMVISPYYFEMDQEKLFVYYDRLAKDVKGDLYLYNFPPRTGHSIAPETIRRLIDVNPNIIGLKDSVSTPGHTNMVCRAVEGKPFTVYSGFDDQFLSNIANNGGVRRAEAGRLTGRISMAKIIAPVVTIFNEEEKPDYAGNKKVIDFLIEGGLDGILVLGSAGEFPDLNEQERLDFFRFYAEYVNGRVELLAGTGCIRYADTLALSNAVYELGYTPMVISPYYFEMDQEKLFVYYDRLAKDVKGDLYLYNFPPRTGHSIAPETIRRLIDVNPNIIGLKDSVSTPGHTNMVCRAVEGKPFTVYSGFDDQFLSNIANNGGGGCIGALSIIVPEIWSSLVKAANERDFDRTFALYHLIQKLMPIYDMDTNCSLILKKLLVHRGLEISDRAVCPFNQMNTAIYQSAANLLDSVLAEYRSMR